MRRRRRRDDEQIEDGGLDLGPHSGDAASTGDQVCSAQEELGSCWKERSEKSDKWESTDTAANADGGTNAVTHQLGIIAPPSTVTLTVTP